MVGANGSGNTEHELIVTSDVKPDASMSPKKRWIVVAIYAIAMAWVESAVVFYLRTMIDRIEPYQANPLPIIGGFGRAEVIREAATMIMLLTVGMLAGGHWRSRLGFMAVAF